jgi:signal transduction histidine kinase
MKGCGGATSGVPQEMSDIPAGMAGFSGAETPADTPDPPFGAWNALAPELSPEEQIDALKRALSRETDDRRRAECMAYIQSDAVQTALDLLVREPDVAGFFRVFTKSLVEQSESHACGVWLLDDEGERCEMWMAWVGNAWFTRENRDSEDWRALSLPSDSMASHLFAYTPGWSKSIEYAGDDSRLPEAVREFHQASNVDSLIVAPLVLPTRNLGWVALSTKSTSECEVHWRTAVVEAMARQATLALHQSRLSEQSRVEVRRQAVLEERNRIARDIHDSLAQGFAAILMQLQATQRSAHALPSSVSKTIEVAVDLARSHMIEARRSVSALRPQRCEAEDIGVALTRLTDLARLTTEVPIELTVDELPMFGGGVEPEIIGIAQEALTNAVRHSRAKKISVHASAVRNVGFRMSVADDGRGIAKERRNTGFGMTSMQERADRIGASLTIVTAPRSGTEVVLAWEPPQFSIPLETRARRETVESI